MSHGFWWFGFWSFEFVTETTGKHREENLTSPHLSVFTCGFIMARHLPLLDWNSGDC